MSSQELNSEEPDEFLAKTEGQDASLFTDGIEKPETAAKRTRMNKTERKFNKYQDKLAKYKLKKLQKKQEKAALATESSSSSSSSKKPRIDEPNKREEEEDRAERGAFLSKRDAKRATLERLNAVYSPDADLSTHLKVYIDCSFGDKMSSKEQSRLAQQIGRCYATNKALDKPVHLTLCNLSEQSPFFAELTRVNSGFENYIVKRTGERVEELNADRLADLVYLSPDASEYLEEVNASRVYVIGGLVDETVNKKVTLGKCADLKIKTYALPIEKYLKRRPGNDSTTSLYSYNKILAINQVFDVLAGVFDKKQGDWPRVLDANVPKRKGFCLDLASNETQ
jgi:tRNA (guanine9-N1)-methyltransferase